MKFRLLFFVRCIMLNIYPLIYSGWSSGCIYSIFGSVRAVAQIISYEVRFLILLINIIIITERFNLIEFNIYQDIRFIFYLYPIFIIFFISILVELNRTPFDLVEGESELVSGFNTEYFSSLFALIFLSEYSRILFIRIINSLIFTGKILSNYIFYIYYIIFIYLIILIRGVLPRIRYDQLIIICWKIFLPISLSYLLFIFRIKFYIIYLIS